MNDKVLLSISLILSALTLLFLLTINLYRETFIMLDWLVVAIDLTVKTGIEALSSIQKKIKTELNSQ